MLPIGIGGNTPSGYNITDSLRFRSSASSYLNRTPTTAGNRKTFTISCWVKRSKLGATQRLFQAKDSASGAYEGIEINSSDQFKLRHHSGAFYEVTTTQVFRDTSAWYHLVATVDTTQATSSNRIKLYVNGEQVTAFATASYPAQNYDFPINDTQEHTIGTYPTGGGEFFDGYMAEVNFVDGQALTPSDFGETNADGVWSPKEYTGTYGTNGFYLPMKETTQATGFNTVTYTGNGAGQSITGVGFSPDLLWIKSRSNAFDNTVFDTIRGAGVRLITNTTAAETATSTLQESFDSDGFTLKTAGSVNQLNSTYVTWCWDAGSSTVSNTDGTITSSVRANPASGFSVVTYTGTGSSGTVGHGLGSTPDMIIVKRRNAVDSWFCYHSALTTDNYMLLNGTNAVQSLSGYWGTPSSTTFGAVYGGTNTSGGTYVAYCFSEVAGYSKFGSYTGNGSTSGPTVTTGFRPAFVMVKSSTLSPSQWTILDNTRSPSNPTDKVLYPNLSNAEADFDSIDFLDDGFQIKNTSGSNNSSGQTYIYMAFADTRDYQWNFDASGNKNNWTPNNINSNASSETTYDLMSDVPSLADEDTGNFATLNPSVGAAGVTNVTLSEANLKYENSDVTYRRYIPSTISIAPSSGKFYCEGVYTVSSQATYDCFGIADAILLGNGKQAGSNVVGMWSYRRNGNADIENTGGATGVAYGDSWAVGDVIGIAYDSDTGSLTFYKNGVSQGQLVTGIDITVCFFVAGFSNCDAYMNFGQRPFKYTPPTGYKKLNTFNLPDSSITDGSQYFNAVTYTGDGGTSNSLSYDFSPDLVWSKSRSNAQSNVLYDSVRGGNKVILSNSTQAENTISPDAISFDSNGHTWTYGYSASNFSGYTYVNWSWRGSDSTAVTNTDGTITSTVSANPTSGFSVVTWTGNGVAGATIGHGLGTAPSVVITKGRSYAQNWAVYHSALGPTKWLQLNSTVAQLTETAIWNNTAPTSSVFTHGSSVAVNPNGGTNVSYCFAEVEGFSKFGSYTGNGSADGPFVYTGFRPAFVMIKRTSGVNSWNIMDNAREGYNPQNDLLFPDSTNVESNVTDQDILSNGFKLRTTGSGRNGNGETYIYMAFAENPFKNSLAR